MRQWSSDAYQTYIQCLASTLQAIPRVLSRTNAAHQPPWNPDTNQAIDYGHTHRHALYKVLVASVFITRMLLIHAIVYPTLVLYVMYACAVIKQLSAMHINYCCLP